MDPLVSIIIPVYQVEKYLDKCIASVVNQTYTNLEIILVNDGSPDNCPALCDQWQSRDSRIKVIHQENGGLSKARNEGMKLATGEFIGFVDSDDWIELNMYETLLSAMLETGADIAICKFQKDFENSQKIIQEPEPPVNKIYTSEKVLELLLTGKSFISTAVWDKLFRRHVIGNIRFLEGKIFEDSLWTPQVIGCANSIVTIDLPLYHYYYRLESLSRNVHDLRRRFTDSSEMLERRIQYFHENFPSLENLAIAKFQVYCCYNYSQVCLKYRQFDSDGTIRRLIHHSFCKWNWSKNLTIGRYWLGIGCLIFRFCPEFFPFMYLIYIKLRYTKYNNMNL